MDPLRRSRWGALQRWRQEMQMGPSKCAQAHCVQRGRNGYTRSHPPASAVVTRSAALAVPPLPHRPRPDYFRGSRCRLSRVHRGLQEPSRRGAPAATWRRRPSPVYRTFAQRPTANSGWPQVDPPPCGVAISCLEAMHKQTHESKASYMKFERIVK